MDSPAVLGKKMYLLDGGFMSGITPYVTDMAGVMKHPLWGSNLLLNNEDPIMRSCKDYVRGFVIFENYNLCSFIHCNDFLFVRHVAHGQPEPIS